MRVGVFGGSFDPVHFGHLILAEQCREQAKLDEVLFVPAARPPHKLDEPPSAFAHRATMLQLAIGGAPGFSVDLLEVERPGPSYTADTLDELRRRRPEDELFLLLGSDSLPDLPSWHDPQRIVARAGLIVTERPGFPLQSAQQVAQNIGATVAEVRLQVVELPLIGISSSDIRRRVAHGRSIRFLVPTAVEEFIHAQGSYRK